MRMTSAVNSKTFKDDLLDKIYFIMERIVVFDGIDDVLNHIVRTSVSLTRSEAATIRTFDVTSGKLKINASHGLSRKYINQSSLNIGEGILGKVVQSGKPFMTKDIHTEKNCVYKELARDEGIHSILSIPLKTKNATIGCLTVYRKTKDKFTDEEMLLLNIFAAQSIEAIDKMSLVENLKRQASHDMLTDTFNRHFLYKRLDEEIMRASRHSLVFSVIFIDIDNFKKFNDEHGHLLGDKLLVDMIHLIKKGLRKNDIIGRFGGEEFVLIAPETDKNGAVSLITKALKQVNKHSFLGNKGDVKGISFSAGISSFPEDGKTSQEIIGNADEAMYLSKKSGKNAVKVCKKPAKKAAGKKKAE
ncbi:MAG: GGDEF domain-containing protein [Nitrospirae bacterium]|nr:GGDEF domain-containing protein [Nitrospirota bacterium]